MEHKTYKSYDELPLMLSVHDVADVLGISMSGAYELVKEKGFPHLRIGARIPHCSEQAKILLCFQYPFLWA